MSSHEETNPFTYSGHTNYFTRMLKQINESLELNHKEIRILSIFAILRIVDLSLTYIFYNKRNAYHLIRLIDYLVLFSSFIVTSLTFINKEKVKQRAVMSCIFFNIVFISFDFMSFIFYFLFEVNTIIILLSLVANEVWMIITSFLLCKIISKLMKIAKNNKKLGNQRGLHSNSSYLRKNY